jgi:hypothetical protein
MNFKTRFDKEIERADALMEKIRDQYRVVADAIDDMRSHYWEMIGLQKSDGFGGSLRKCADLVKRAHKEIATLKVNAAWSIAAI